MGRVRSAMANQRRKAKAKDPRTTTYEHLSAQEAAQTNRYRDVYKNQQVHRSDIGRVKGYKALQVTAGVLFALGAVGGHSVVAGGELVAQQAQRSWDGMMNSTPPFTYISEEFEMPATVYYQVDADGNHLDGVAYANPEDVPEPLWYAEAVAQWQAEKDTAFSHHYDSYKDAWFDLSFPKTLGAIGGGAGLAALPMMALKRRRVENVKHDVVDINQHQGDQHIQEPEELFERYDFAPDVGAHFDREVSSMLSHVFFSPKGLKKVAVARRYEKDVIDEETGDVLYYKGEIVLGPNGSPVVDQKPIIDVDFGQALYEASGVPKEKLTLGNGKSRDLRHFFDTTKIQYNKGGKNRDRLNYDTLKDVINDTWDVPLYEPQRPAGAYIIDTAPVNTMILAITRAGKGQTYIEPVLDLWMRERKQHNFVVNDPKGELMVKNYVRATVRGYQVIQFNLINPMKTDIYNPLGMAAEAAREGDSTKCAMYVGNIADVFFPTDGGEDPVWPNAANNAFKRAAYGLIDYYLEEERELRREARVKGTPASVLETILDESWGRVTLYNCYQLFTQMTSKKLPSPMAKLNADFKSGKIDEETFQEKAPDAERKTELIWRGAAEADLLTLYGNATMLLPQNSMRTLYSNADNALRSMAGAEKMLASVYGIAITAMNFFADPTIATMTSGRPSQNTDLGALSFPRRMGVRMNANYIKERNYIGAQCRWSAYGDAGFTQDLGKDFYHEDIVSREGWARYYFEGIFPQDVGYVKLELVHPTTGLVLNTFYFQFTKNYTKTLDGRFYVTDPVLEERIIKNGLLVELQPDAEGKYVPSKSTFKRRMLVLDNDSYEYVVDDEGRDFVFVSDSVRYTETPKALFLVTPPHLMSYAKLILILIKQLVDLNFDKSYMTKPNQKPMRKTRFMLDELGNLQSEGKGISGLQTMLSIGLGQEQQFTLILQTLQQLREVYGESSDKIIQGNTSNIIYLKSTDDAMIETLEKMSGSKHVVYKNSKTVREDLEKVGYKVEGDISYTFSVEKEPVISYNDMAYLSERNSIVFRAGDSPIWNRNETILPMSWRLFKDTIEKPGADYTLQTLPTTSTALQFDIRLNMPDFTGMLHKRMAQAMEVEEIEKTYREAFNYSEIDVQRQDPDIYAEELMNLIDEKLTTEREVAAESQVEGMGDDELAQAYQGAEDWGGEPQDNDDVIAETTALREEQSEAQRKRYAGGMLSRAEMISPANAVQVTSQLERYVLLSYLKNRTEFLRRPGMVLDGERLMSADGLLYIDYNPKAQHEVAEAVEQRPDFSDSIDMDEVDDLGSYTIQPEFWRHLTTYESWRDVFPQFDKMVQSLLEESM